MKTNKAEVQSTDNQVLELKEIQLGLVGGGGSDGTHNAPDMGIDGTHN